MPMLALTNSSLPSISKASSSECRMRSATTMASSGVDDVLEQHGELVAAEPRDGVAGAQRGRDAPGERDQQVVADRVAEAVVDELEAVDVQEQHRAAGLRDRAATRCRIWLTPVHEQGPVGQAGERVVQRVVLEAQLGDAAVGDVRQRARPSASGGRRRPRIARPRVITQRQVPSAWRIRCSDCRWGVRPSRWASIAPRSRSTSPECTRSNQADGIVVAGLLGLAEDRVPARREVDPVRSPGPSPRSRRWRRARPARSAPRCSDRSRSACWWLIA